MPASKSKAPRSLTPPPPVTDAGEAVREMPRYSNIGGLLLVNIRRDLIVRYRDLSDPWYGWALPAYQAEPYRAVVDDLVSLGATVSDETDLNDDVSCRYSVSRGGAALTAELSLVGPCAAVLDAQADSHEPITPGTLGSDLARDLLGVLNARGLHILDADALHTPVNMPFQNVEAGHGTLYQALISDTPSPFTPMRDTRQ